MQPYISRLWTFLALSGPHCGNLFSTSYVVDSGASAICSRCVSVTHFVLVAMWVMKNWKKSACLKQLSLSDHAQKRDCFLYHLSQKPGKQRMQLSKLPGFLFCVMQAWLISNTCCLFPLCKTNTCQVTLRALKCALQLWVLLLKKVKSHNHCVISARMSIHFVCAGDLYYSMVRGLLEPVIESGTALMRIDVSFGIKKANLDTAIGRTAHILFLESAHFLKMFCHLYGHYFTEDLSMNK